MLGIRRACGAPPGLLGKLDASGEKAAAGKCSRSPLSPTSPLQAVLLLSWGCAGWESPWGLVQTWGLREVGGLVVRSWRWLELSSLLAQV